MYVSYIFFPANQTSSVKNADREELYASLRANLTKNWGVTVYNRQNLATNGGSLEMGTFVSYEDECTKIIFNIEKDNSNDPNYKGDFKFGINFFLKTLGGVGTK